MSATTFSVHRSVLCATALLVGSFSARAAIIIDDFDDPAETISPAMMNEQVYTESVGDLDALRRMGIFGSRVAAVGNMTIDDSLLQAELAELEPTAIGAISAVQTLYRFTELLGVGHEDLTEGGRSNAVILDFEYLTYNVEPSWLRLTVFDGNTTWLTETAVPFSADPFRMMVPFELFRPRGGGASIIDMTQVVDITWSFRFDAAGVLPEDVQFSMAFDRFSVGRIPEPSSLVMLLIAVIPTARMAQGWFDDKHL